MNDSGILNAVSNALNNGFRKIEERGRVVSTMSLNKNTLARIKKESKIISVDHKGGSEYLWTADIETDGSLNDNEIRLFGDTGKLERIINI